MDDDRVEDHELLFRRVPDGKVDRGRPIMDAFLPDPSSIDGLSLFRAAMVTCEQIAPKVAKNPYWVAVFVASDLRELGLELKVSPTDDHGDAHIILPQMRRDNRKDEWVQKVAFELWQRMIRLEGPFSHHLQRGD